MPVCVYMLSLSSYRTQPEPVFAEAEKDEEEEGH